MTIEDLKKALGGFFYKDLARYEPGRVGVAIGEDIRIHEQDGVFVVRFLKETPYGPKKQLADRLAQAKIPYTVGEDFTL